MEDIALNNSFGADAAAPPPRPPRAAESARNRRDSSPDARDSQHSERSQGKSACCAAGCCGDFSEPDAVGPMAKPRKCRDIFCLLLLLLVWAGWIVMLWVTATEGCPVTSAIHPARATKSPVLTYTCECQDNCNDPRKLVFGTDSETGSICPTVLRFGHRKFGSDREKSAARRGVWDRSTGWQVQSLLRVSRQPSFQKVGFPFPPPRLPFFTCLGLLDMGRVLLSARRP